MAFTDFCDIFGSFHEDGFNRIVSHLQLQRPSLFNYGTEDMLKKERQFCSPIEVHRAVNEFNNPKITVSPYLPIPGYAGPFGMSYLMQLTKILIDFHPSNSIDFLPPELNPPLDEEQFALQASFCVGMGCPSKKVLDNLGEIDFDLLSQFTDLDFATGKPEYGIPFEHLNCFCLDVYATLHMERANGELRMKLDGFEIVDIRPEGLENALECYVEAILRLSVLPKIKIRLQDLVFNIQEYVTILPTPISSDVPFNPSVANDTLSLYVNLNT